MVYLRSHQAQEIDSGANSPTPGQRSPGPGGSGGRFGYLPNIGDNNTQPWRSAGRTPERPTT